MAIFNSYVKLPEGTQAMAKRCLGDARQTSTDLGKFTFWSFGKLGGKPLPKGKAFKRSSMPMGPMFMAISYPNLSNNIQ